MADERRGNFRRFGRRRQVRGDRSAAPQGPGSPEAVEEIARPGPPQDCGYCHKPIYDLSTALADREGGGPVHFDCALQRVSERESLAPGERIVYIGSGVFAVVEYRDRSETSFTVKRRLPFEEEGKKQDWRKVLSARVTNL